MGDRSPEERLSFWLEALGVISGILGVSIGIFIVGSSVGSAEGVNWFRLAIGSVLALFSAMLFLFAEAVRKILLRVFDAE